MTAFDILNRCRRDEKTGCMVWQGPTFPWGGYGMVLVNRKQRRAHRLLFELLRGPIPPGMSVCHRCDNPPCCEPAHLFLGTHAENMADMAAKGRAHSHAGDRNPRSRLSAAQVAEARARLAVGQSAASVARVFGVSGSAVRDALAGKTWNPK